MELWNFATQSENKFLNKSNILKYLAYTYYRGGMYMEISKENIFNVKYTSVLENKGEKKKRTSAFIKCVRENKLISISIIVFLMCVGMNLVLIFNFFKILQQV